MMRLQLFQKDEVTSEFATISLKIPFGLPDIEIVGSHVVPEFGAMAALILAVSIISIIVVSAKSRLSIMPKF